MCTEGWQICQEIKRLGRNLTKLRFLQIEIIRWNSVSWHASADPPPPHAPFSCGLFWSYLRKTRFCCFLLSCLLLIAIILFFVRSFIIWIRLLTIIRCSIRNSKFRAFNLHDSVPVRNPRKILTRSDPTHIVANMDLFLFSYKNTVVPHFLFVLVIIFMYSATENFFPKEQNSEAVSSVCIN